MGAHHIHSFFELFLSQDIGNVNLSFLTSKHEYKRLKNLEFIIRVLRNQLGIKDVTISPREDLMLFDRFKVFN